jgi:hypothetical protein
VKQVNKQLSNLLEMLSDMETKRKQELVDKYKKDPKSLSDMDKKELGELEGRDNIVPKTESKISESFLYKTIVELEITNSDLKIYLGLDDEIDSIETKEIEIRWDLVLDKLNNKARLIVEPDIEAITIGYTVAIGEVGDDEEIESDSVSIPLDEVQVIFDTESDAESNSVYIEPKRLEIEFTGKDIIIGKLIF